MDPELPAAYRLISVEMVENLRDHVQALATDGIEEGTLILADRVRKISPHGPCSYTADGQAGNLHAALVLEPDFPSERDHEILFVALVSLAHAIATHVSPLTALRFGWPNEVRIASYRVGAVWLDRGESAGRRWLTITLTVNVTDTLSHDSQEEMSLHQAEGHSSITPQALFASWAREFIRWINVWDDRGFRHVLDQWKARVDVTDCPVSIQQPGGVIEGVGSRVDEEGRLVIRRKDGTEARLSSRLFLGWESF